MPTPPTHRRASSYRPPTSPRGTLPVRAHSGIPASAVPEPSLLLLPLVRLPNPPQSQSHLQFQFQFQPQPVPRSPRLTPKHHPRSRAASVSPSLSEQVALARQNPPLHDVASEWIGLPVHFELVHEQLEIDGYQLYAVEKWIVQRTRPVTVLAVYTGDPDHKITVAALAPSSSLSPQEAKREWEKALHHLRADGARPKLTPHGVLMATSLAHFRSDYTIVHIPNGNFLAIKDQLYVNINLLRMGCSGRTALTLEEPSDTTKDRFISMYHLPDATFSYSTLPSSERQTDFPAKTSSLSKVATDIGLGRPSITIVGPTPTNSTISASPTTYHEADRGKKYKDKDRDKDKEKEKATLAVPQAGKGKTKDRALFNATVLELVKLIQAGLAIFGLCGKRDAYAVVPLDGLLCDVTVDGIRRWIEDIGEPCAGLEPMERVADPMFVSALISLVLSIRNKLAALGYGNVIPKDPFLHPFGFVSALTMHLQCTSPIISHSSGPSSAIASAANSTFLPMAHNNQGLYTFAYPHVSMFHPGQHTQSSSVASSLTQITSSSTGSPQFTVLTRELVEAIEGAYDAKVRVGEGRKVRRVLKGKLDDLTNAVAGVDSEGDGVDRERGRGGTLSAGEGGGAGQVIGTLASGLGLGGSTAGSPSSVLEATVDLVNFVNTLTGKDGGGRVKRRARDRMRESVDLGMVGLGEIGKREGFTGHVADLVRLRELERERERDGIGDAAGGKKEKESSRKERLGIVGSDGDVPDERGPNGMVERRRKRAMLLSAHQIVSAEFGVRGCRENWNLGQGYLEGKPRAEVSPSPSAKKPGNLSSSGPQSPTLPPMMFSSEGREDEEELLSSGQVSPIGEFKPNPFNVIQDSAHPSGGSSVTNLNSITSSEFAKLISQKRPWNRRLNKTRLATWSDPLSAKAEEDDAGEESAEGERSDASRTANGKQREGFRFQSMLSLTSLADGEGVIHEEPAEMEEIPPPKRGPFTDGSQRRRSFHDMESFRGMHILRPEQMRIDVELCGQMLIISRREEHLRNVMECLEVVAVRLSDKTAALERDYQSHLEMLNDLGARVKILSDIDEENAKMEEIIQATNTLSYESEQFRVPDLWHTASHSRAKVLLLREQVFGTGGRRLPPGVHGAHGRFNRLQWTLDGRERLVDYLGRTESEAEEESKVDPHSLFIRPPEEDEEDVVEHSSIKPMWLLRFFMGWGARWSTSKDDDKNGKGKGKDKNGKSTSDDKGVSMSPPLGGEKVEDNASREDGNEEVEKVNKLPVVRS
ncbi:hypothetical protein BDQ17DRAFT_1422232 [Cyathus striatus]|nr:hypothetical protein BDQ17DRAFT_1422232 [Cyathus striatus]